LTDVAGYINMVKRGKKYLQSSEKNQMMVSSIKDALDRSKELAFVKFDESVDVHINLGIDPTKGDQVVRGSVVLPHGKGKKVKVLVFAKGEHADAAQKAGADYVGEQELVDKIQGGWMDFDYTVATPDMMGTVGRLAKLLGPRGLLPNKKLGTVTFDVATIVKELKQGRVFFRNDKQGLVHFSFGRVSFDTEKLLENLIAVIKALVSAKPSTSKGKYLKKVTVSTSMGVGVSVNPDEFL
jgi:large subunit ribosomal protein L1